jgi:rare lipoprotein A
LLFKTDLPATQPTGWALTFGTIFVVTNLENGRKIRCPVQDRGPYARGRVLDFSLGAAREIGCDGLCRVNIRRAGYE